MCPETPGKERVHVSPPFIRGTRDTIPKTFEIQALQISAQNIVSPSFSRQTAAIRQNLREARPEPRDTLPTGNLPQR